MLSGVLLLNLGCLGLIQSQSVFFHNQPTANEELGNFFNVPSVTAPQQQQQQQQQQQGQPLQFPLTPTYINAPPRQTHFFGNNYDFFRQFHAPPAPLPHQITNVVSTPAKYNGYEDAGKALGLSQGLRVVTTESLKTHPVVLHSDEIGPSPTPSSSSTPTNPSMISSGVVGSRTTPTIHITTSPTGASPTTVEVEGRTGRPSSSPSPSPTSSAVRTFYNEVQDFGKSSPFVSSEPGPTTFRPNFFNFFQSPPTPTPYSSPVLERATERPLYNALHPGQLYRNTNGAYNGYYEQQGGRGSGAGLEEIPPQYITFNVPAEMIQLEQPQQQQQQPEQKIQAEEVSVGGSSSSSPADATPAPAYILGPKGRRLVKKKRKPTTATLPTAAPSPTNDEEDGPPSSPPARTLRPFSRSRISGTSTLDAKPGEAATEAAAAPSPKPDGDNNALIQSRLRSSERQIRFRSRNKNAQ